ncbi:MAG: hypothetical protein DWQ05_12410 [Calditrichaeota bacterium]|nr:MAG: hypothetical protein DWQ05_12410 [Calditrichota bacterium]
MQLSRHLDKGFWATATNAVKALYGFGVVFWLIVVFPKSAFANFLIVQTTYLICAQLITSFSLSAYIKFYYEKSDRVELQSSGILLFWGTSIIVFLMFLLIYPYLGQLINMDIEYDLLLFVPALYFASAAKLYTNEVFKATHQIKAFFLTELVFFASHSTMLVIIYFNSGLHKAEDVLSPMVAAYVLSSLLGVWLARNYIIYKFKFSLTNLKQAIHFNRFVFAIGVSNNIFEHVDTYIVASFMNKPALALFGALKLFTRIFTMFRQVVGIIGFPAFSRLHSEGRQKDLKSLYEKGIYYASLLLGSIVLLVIVFANFIFDSILTNYAGNGFFLQIFILLGLWVGWQTIGDNLLYGIGKPQVVFYNRMAVSILNIFLNVILISMYGITGAIITANITMFLLMLSTTYFVRKNIGFTFRGIWNKHRDLYFFVNDFLKKN